MTEPEPFQVGEHTHPLRTPLVVWALVAAVVILGAAVAGIGLHLAARQSYIDSRNTRTSDQTAALRQAVCTVLDPIPAGRVNGVDKARALPFPTSGHTEPLCPPMTVRSSSHPAGPASAATTRTAASRGHVAPRSPRRIGRTPTVAPPPTRSPRPSPPSSTPRPTATPRPTPCVTLLPHRRVCL